MTYGNSRDVVCRTNVSEWSNRTLAFRNRVCRTSNEQNMLILILTSLIYNKQAKRRVVIRREGLHHSSRHVFLYVENSIGYLFISLLIVLTLLANTHWVHNLLLHLVLWKNDSFFYLARLSSVVNIMSGNYIQRCDR